MVRDRTVYKEVVDFHINDKTRTECSLPVDFSFSGMKSLLWLHVARARGDRVGNQPALNESTNRYLTKSVWFNNNHLKTTRNIEAALDSIVDRPADIKWIDFSYNRINVIDKSIGNYKCITILYFHGNKIDSLEQVAVLRPLKQLHSVTFHGNPIAHVPEYRKCILALIPQIKTLDFSPILNMERKQTIKPEALKLLQRILANKSEEKNN